MSATATRTVKSVNGTAASLVEVGDVLVVADWDDGNRLLQVRTVDLVGDDVVLNEGQRDELTTSVGNLLVVVKVG